MRVRYKNISPSHTYVYYASVYLFPESRIKIFLQKYKGKKAFISYASWSEITLFNIISLS